VALVLAIGPFASLAAQWPSGIAAGAQGRARLPEVQYQLDGTRGRVGHLLPPRRSPLRRGARQAFAGWSASPVRSTAAARGLTSACSRRAWATSGNRPEEFANHDRPI
jgi:hypothetical protein